MDLGLGNKWLLIVSEHIPPVYIGGGRQPPVCGCEPQRFCQLGSRRRPDDRWHSSSAAHIMEVPPDRGLNIHGLVLGFTRRRRYRIASFPLCVDFRRGSLIPQTFLWVVCLRVNDAARRKSIPWKRTRNVKQLSVAAMLIMGCGLLRTAGQQS